MLSSKPILLVSAAALLVSAASVASQPLVPAKSPLDLVVGSRQPGDALVHTDHFFREPREKRIIAFRPFDVPDEYTITQVRALDLTAGTGGIVTYEYGGPGMNRVLLGFHSKAKQGISYTIELYGVPYEGRKKQQSA